MIYVTGDTHGADCDFVKILWLAKEKHLTKDDYVIIVGDFGFIFEWDGPDDMEKWWLRFMQRQPYNILFLDGNHECFPRINACPEEEWHGGKVHRIRKNILHLMRSQVYEIEGKTFFVMGGAQSTDMTYRVEGQTWWPEELPDDGEYKEADAVLEKHHHSVDYILTHCAPTTIENIVYPSVENRLTRYFDHVAAHTQFKHWYFGHYHLDMDVGDKFSCLYYRVLPIDD